MYLAPVIFGIYLLLIAPRNLKQFITISAQNSKILTRAMSFSEGLNLCMNFTVLTKKSSSK